MGSPSVFQTAPPQPASNARSTCSPQFAGGPDASQKGLGQLIAPANMVVRSAILDSLRSGPICNRRQVANLPYKIYHAERCSFSFGYCIYYFSAAVHAVACGVVARICGLAR